MKEKGTAASRENDAPKSWISRLLDWLARGHRKAVESGKHCPT
ncbi:hypothetical protein [Desulfococcus sp.]